jgi:hypothetical protein
MLNVCKFCLNEGTESDKIKAIFPPALNNKTEQVRIVTFYKHKMLIPFYWWRKPECQEKTTDLLQVTHKSYNVVSSTHHLSGTQTHNFSGERARLHRQLYIRLSYDHGHDDPCKTRLV